MTRASRQQSSLALLLDRPQPVGFVLVRIVAVGGGINLAPSLRKCSRPRPRFSRRVCVDRWPGRDVGRSPQARIEARWRQRSGSPRGTSARAPSCGSRAPPSAELRRSNCCSTLDLRQRGRDEGDDVRRGNGVEVFMANDLQPSADHVVECLAGVDQFAGELHRFALHAAPSKRSIRAARRGPQSAGGSAGDVLQPLEFVVCAPVNAA